MTIGDAMAIVGLGAAAAAGRPERLLQALDRAEASIPLAEVEEYLLQTYLFAGFPRTINAFYTFQGWVAADAGRRREPRPPERPRPAAWRERGEALCRLVYDRNYEALQKRLARLHPALAEWTLVEGYGKVLGRSGAGPAGRELAAVGALLVIEAARQLVAHLQGAVHAGVEPRIVVDAVSEVAAGWGLDPWAAGMLERAGLA